MKILSRWSLILCWWGLAVSGLFAQSEDISRILDQASARLEAFPELDSWQALVTSSQIQMDRRWEPKKKLVVRKRIRISGENRREEVLEALETEKGRTRDVTAEYRERARKEEAEGDAESRSDSDRDHRKGRRGFTLTDENLFPFSEEARKNYEFIRNPDSDLQGIPVLVLESRAVAPKRERLEGRYYFDRENLVVLRAELKPSKVPGVLKTIEMDFWFNVLPEGYLVLKKTRIKLDAAVVVKRIRMLTEEEYSDYQVLDP